MMPDRKDICFFPIFIGATLGVLLEIIATLVDEIVVGSLFSDEAFASVNLTEPYIQYDAGNRRKLLYAENLCRGRGSLRPCDGVRADGVVCLRNKKRKAVRLFADAS